MGVLPLVVASIVIGVGGGTEVGADGGTPPSIDVLENGAAASLVSVDDTVTLRVTSPVTEPGTQNVELVANWSATTGAISGASDVTAPVGWVKTFTTDGANYVPNPANWSAVIGVKAVGSVTSSGFTAPNPAHPLGLQNVSASANGVIRPTLASFQGSSAGDGWNVFHGLGNVYNFYHHGGADNWTTGIDCHNRRTSASCWSTVNSGAYLLPYGQYLSPARSWGHIDEANSRAWGFFKRGSDNAVGFLCFDVSSSGPRLCPGVGVGGFVSVSATSVAKWEGLGDMEFYAGRLWARTHDANSPILCMVVATANPCDGQPYTPVASYSAPGGDRTTHRNRIFLGKMYFTSGNSRMDCVDLALPTPVRCTGNWPVTTSALPAGWNFRFPIFAVTSGGGARVDKVCVHNSHGGANNSCFTTTGDVTTSAGNLAGTGGYSADGWGDNFNFMSKDRYYFNNGSNLYRCWDFSLNNGAGGACTGYAAQNLGNSVYMVSADPEDENCLWSNGHTGAIKPFNALTGALNCAPAGPTADFKTPTLVSRLPCSSDTVVRRWTSLRVSPPNGFSPSAAKLTVLVGGLTTLNSWKDVPVTSSTATEAVFDLTSLSVVDSGQSPTFAVAWASGTLTTTPGQLTYETQPAQLCVDLRVDSPCPTGNGQSATSTLPGVALTVSGSTRVGSNPSVSVNSVVAAADNTTCLGAVEGILTRTGQPVVDAVVTLMPANGSPIQVTTSAQGFYSIPRLFPGTYPIVFGVVNDSAPDVIIGTASIPRNSTTTVSATYGVDALRAPDITRTVTTNNEAVFSVGVTGGSGTFDPSLTRLVDPTTGATVSAVTSTGQPAWSLGTDGHPRASGVGVAGTYYAIYEARTSGGSTARGLLKLIVTNPTPAPVIGFVPPTSSTTTRAPGTTVPPTTRVPNPPVPIPLAPGGTASLPELPVGSVVVTEGDEMVEATIEKVGDVTWQTSGRGFQWQMQIPALGSQAGSDRGVVTLVTDRDVEISGFGFKGESLVDLWLFSTPIYIGTVRVDANGNFVDALRVPSNITPGEHTLQANGITPDGLVRTLNLGVRVLPSNPQLPVTGGGALGVVDWAMWVLAGGSFLAMARRRLRHPLGDLDEKTAPIRRTLHPEHQR